MLCGHSCAEVHDALGATMCSMTWRDGCKASPPPEGFQADGLVRRLCPVQCQDAVLRWRSADEDERTELRRLVDDAHNEALFDKDDL